MKFAYSVFMAAVVGGLSAFAAEIPGSEAYVDFGLIAHWDGIDNTLTDGVRSHTADATTWYDLSGHANDVTIPSSYVTVESNAFLSAADVNKKADTDTTATLAYPTLASLRGLECGTNDAPFTVEVVAQRVKWNSSNVNYDNLQSIFTTPRGAVGYRLNKDDGFYLQYPPASH